MSQWLQDSIKNGLIKFFDFNEFSDVKVLARGAFGEVSRAYWNSGEKTVALKTLYNSPELENDKAYNDFINEFQLIRSVDFHDNVIRFFGLSQGASTVVSDHIRIDSIPSFNIFILTRYPK
ncbi:14644_t:CDS:2 [Acaulospora morrowiae]|uniref:14644_t:CDS:1 n=1 Tax=Acaulospora morrowiae TaxID=94023 RepID=A0A9N9IG45_9GLOM|nr:14644_t:CDS:2 [Acaulospora morrowiae]